MTSPDQFRPGPPPDLGSSVWVRDFNEVKSLGARNGSTRTEEQTEIARFWEATKPSIYHGLVRTVADQPGREITRNARLLAAIAQGMDDALVAVFDAKYHYNFWRPVTAIRNGDIDGNDATERDPGWTPLNMTPMHPEYPSQATMNATVAAAVLQSVFGPVAAIPLTVTDVADAKKTRHFASIADMVEEQKNVRIWGGVHYRSAIDTGAEMGRQLSAYMIDNALKPAP
jgi:hypothetical protein